MPGACDLPSVGIAVLRAAPPFAGGKENIVELNRFQISLKAALATHPEKSTIAVGVLHAKGGDCLEGFISACGEQELAQAQGPAERYCRFRQSRGDVESRRRSQWKQSRYSSQQRLRHPHRYSGAGEPDCRATRRKSRIQLLSLIECNFNRLPRSS